METKADYQRQYNELDKEAGKYNRPEFDQVYTVISELVKDRDDVGDKGNLALPLAAGSVIDEALSRSGFADDDAFVSDFKKYREIEQRAREIQLKGLELHLQENPPQRKIEPEPDEWQFYPISIIAPKPIMDEVLTPMLEADASEGKGLFANISNIPDEDEFEDALLKVKIYNCEASFVPYWDELKNFGVIGRGKEDAFFNVSFKRALLEFLNELATYTENNTNKPAEIKNHISSVIKEFDNIPIWGLFFQILIIQGLCRWLECMNINEGDNGYNEAVSLYNWLLKILEKKELTFCFTPYGDKDKEKLKPLCDYLYSTELGKMVQEALFKHEDYKPQQVNNDKTAGEINLPSELNTERARKYFARAIKAKYMSATKNGYKWNFGDGKGQARLGYFCNKVFATPRPINKLEEFFDVKNFHPLLQVLIMMQKELM